MGTVGTVGKSKNNEARHFPARVRYLYCDRRQRAQDEIETVVIRYISRFGNCESELLCNALRKNAVEKLL